MVNNVITLRSAYARFPGDPPSEIPWQVWLLENPASPLALPGSIALREHDYLHVLLDLGMSAREESFVVGTTIGNARGCKQIHLKLFRFVARYLYPPKYRFSNEDLRAFELGVAYGRSLAAIEWNKALEWLDAPLAQTRQKLGIDIKRVKEIQRGNNLSEIIMTEPTKNSEDLINWLKTQDLAGINLQEQYRLAKRVAQNYSPEEMEATKQEILRLIQQAQERDRTQKLVFNSLIFLCFLTAIIFLFLS